MFKTHLVTSCLTQEKIQTATTHLSELALSIPPLGARCGAPGLLAVLKLAKLIPPQALSFSHFLCLECSLPHSLNGSLTLFGFLLPHYLLRGAYLTSRSQIRQSGSLPPVIVPA